MKHNRIHQTFWTAAVIGLLFAAFRFNRPMIGVVSMGDTSWLAIAAALTGCLTATFGRTKSGKAVCYLFVGVVVSALTLVLLMQPFSALSSVSYAGGGLLLFFCAKRSAHFGSAETLSKQFSQNVPYDELWEWELHREMHRARYFKRPLSLVILSPTVSHTVARNAAKNGKGSPAKVDLEKLSELLSRNLKAYDILMLQDGLFVLVLTETETTVADLVTRRLASVANEQFGVHLHIGIAGFPGEEVTLTGLWALAKSRLNRTGSSIGIQPATNGKFPSIGTAAAIPVEHLEGVAD